MIRASQQYFESKTAAEERGGFLGLFESLRRRTTYSDLSKALESLAKDLPPENLDRFIKFCTVDFEEWIREWLGLVNRTKILSVNLDALIRDLARLPLNDEEVGKIIADVGASSGKLSDLASEDLQQAWTAQWLEIAQTHYLEAIAPNRVRQELRRTILKDSPADRIGPLQMRVFDVVLGESVADSPVSHYQARLESLGSDFISKLRAALKKEWEKHFNSVWTRPQDRRVSAESDSSSARTWVLSWT